MCEWGGGRCDAGPGGAGFGHDRTTPWGNLRSAVVMAGSDSPLHGGQTTKNASGQAAGSEGADMHQVWVARRQPGWAARAGGGSPAHQRWCYACLGPVSSPWHSELRQAAPRALSRVALLVGRRAGHSLRLAEPQPRRIDATRGQGRCPKVSAGAERRQAGRRHSTRGPVSPRARQAACRGDVGRQLACPTGELLQHPTRQVGSRHATHTTTTRHDRHTAPARHVGRRVTREDAAVTQPLGAAAAAAAAARGRSWIERARAPRSIEVFSVGRRAARPPRG